MRVAGEQPVAAARSAHGVDLVEHEQGVLLFDAELREHAADGGDLRVDQRARGVGDVEEQVGLAGLLERRPEAGDQAVGQVADEADGVGEEHRAPAGQPPAPGARVERGEELVLGEHVGAGERR